MMNKIIKSGGFSLAMITFIDCTQATRLTNPKISVRAITSDSTRVGIQSKKVES